MELEYQSHRNVDINKQLNRLDKVNSKLALTIKDLPYSEQLPQQLKDKIVTFISNDKTKDLLRLMHKEVVVWSKEIGAKGTQWNCLHLCSKFNAANSLRILLKKIYQIQKEEYTRAVNTQTAEGFTILMIATIYKSDKILQLLLRLGGVDLSLIEKGKLRAYDLALHYRNEFAIGQLIVYEDRCRKKGFINESQLSADESLLHQKSSFFEQMTNYLIDCFICFQNEAEEQKKETIFAKMNPMAKSQKASPIDLVKLGSRNDIEDYEIQWKRLSLIKGQKVALFDSFKPQDIYESQFSLKNSLILLQTLSDFPWLLRKIITRIEMPQGNPEKYSVFLYKNGQSTKIEVDQCVPIVKQRGQPMFLSNRSQIWPMILQKAMAKLHGSYLTLDLLSTTQALQSITGFYVKQMQLNQIAKQNGVVSAFQELALRGYLVLLQGRPRTDLNTNSQLTSFAILNYYQKGSSKKLLISCPNMVENWKDSKENRQLAILKAHFSRHNQSCLWIDEFKLEYYFSHAVVVFLKQGYIRSDLKMKFKIKNQSESRATKIKSDTKSQEYKKSIFFKLKVENHHEEPILMQLTDLQTRKKFDLSNLQGWKNDGSQAMIKQEEYSGCQQLIKFSCFPGQYLCKFNLTADKPKEQKISAEMSKRIIKRKDGQDENSECKKKVKLNLGPEHLREIQLTVWGPEQVQLELLEESFGTIEWLAQYRNYTARNWKTLIGQGQQYLSQTINGKTIVIARKMKDKSALLIVPKSWCSCETVQQGKYIEDERQVNIQMVKDDQNGCVYCVLLDVHKLEDVKEVRVEYV